MFELTPEELMVLIMVIAVIAVMQFFKGRKLNLMLMEFTARKLEEVLKPRDKIYQWIGLYVGYRAVFKLLYKTLNRAEVTVLLIPRQSLFYYPIAMLTSRFDKLFLVYWFNRPFYKEAHVVRKGYYRKGIKRVIKNIESLRVDRLNIMGKQYYLVYNDASVVDVLVKFVKSLSEPHVVNHIAIVPSNKTLYLALKLKPQVLEEVLRKSYELARSLA